MNDTASLTPNPSNPTQTEDAATLVAQLRRQARVCKQNRWGADARLFTAAANEIDRLASLSPRGRGEGLEEAIEQAAKWFDEYAEMHLAKPDYDKAARNTSRAVYLRSALSSAPVSGGGEIAEIASDMRKQLPVTKAYLTDNGINAHFADVLLSHYYDFAIRIEEVALPPPPATGEVGT
jgi:hypothetical protein